MPVSRSKRSRYIPPPKPKPKPSPRWVPALMVGLLAVGVVILVLYYLSSSATHLLPGGPRVGYLLLGFALIAGGFFTGVFWR